MKLLRVLFLLVVPCHVFAFPLASNQSTVTAKTYIPLVVISISLFFLLVAIKLVYMKHRIGTIHAPPRVHSVPGGDLSSSSSGLQNKQVYRHRGFLVGCLGSPTWETDLTSRLDVATWRREQRPRSPFVYQRYTMRSARSTSARIKSKNASSSSCPTNSTVLTSYSTDADLFVPPLLSGHSRIPTGHSGRSLGSVQRTMTRSHYGYGDFGESRYVRPAGGSAPRATRRASPSSIRLVDGHSQVEYSFLSGLPPDAIVVSPLNSTRDSFQLSRCSLKYNRRAVPPLPPLPSFLSFCLPKDFEALESFSPEDGEYLPALQFSPLVSVAKVFQYQQQAVERKAPSCQTLDSDENRDVPDPNCAASRLASSNDTGSFTSTCIVQDTPSLCIIQKTDHKRTSPQTTNIILEDSARPLKSCLRQVYNPELALTPASTADESPS